MGGDAVVVAVAVVVVACWSPLLLLLMMICLEIEAILTHQWAVFESVVKFPWIPLASRRTGPHLESLGMVVVKRCAQRLYDYVFPLVV